MPETPAYREDVATDYELDHLDSQAPTLGREDRALAEWDEDPAELAALFKDAPPDNSSPANDLAMRLLAIALKEKGDAEHPKGSDRNKFTDWWRIRLPWAAIFSLWVADQLGDRTLLPWSASSAAQVREWRMRDRWYTPSSSGPPRQGDLFYVTGGPTGIEHSGFVAAVDEGTGFWSIEGGWEHTVVRVHRNWESGHIAGFGRPDYAGSASTRFAPFPGRTFFQAEPRSAIITRMGRRLVHEDCAAYEQGPGPLWSNADRKSYALWQAKCKIPGVEPDGWPDATTWERLRVPKA